MFNNIPHELQALRQWLVWKLEDTDDGKPTKVPYNPRTGYLASTTDPTTWGTFAEACNMAFNGYNGIGFVFTRNDPYCGIDLDSTDDVEAFNRQLKIYEMMESYSERSPSGKGLHIIVKAALPHGRKRASIEIYSSERYFTFTGNVYRDAPIAERQLLTQRLWEEMGQGASTNYYQGDQYQKSFDDEVIEACRRAVNGDLFNDLFTGQWQHRYSSHSEADQALMNFLVFHTKFRPQIFRIFRMSALGQRDKAQRDKYLGYTIDKAFDQTLPPIDIDGVFNQVKAALAQEATQTAPPLVVSNQPVDTNTGARTYDGFNIDMWRTMPPPGVLSQVTDFVFAQSPRPVREIALTAALGLLSGICGRAYNISGTGLNLYLMMLAPTGRGKEAMASGINKIASAVAATDYPAIWEFIGPSDMASGTGLMRHLSERPTPCFVALTGEIGLRLQQMSNAKANAADITLRRVLLDLYNKSGAGQVIRPSVYADKKNNVEMINSPAFTWLGESTPAEFYRSLEEGQITSGLLPRFTIVEYDGLRVTPNEHHDKAYPPSTLVAGVRAIADTALKAMHAGQVINVGMTDLATDWSRQFNTYCDDKINNMEDSPLVNLWNRAHFKVLRIAALLAVAHNYHAPLVDHHMIEWAASLVLTDVLTLIGKFESGVVGEAENSDAEQVDAFKHNIRNIVRAEPGSLRTLSYEMHSAYIIPYRVMQQRLTNIQAFKKDRKGGGLDRVIATLIKGGVLSELPHQQIVEKFGANQGKCYAVSRPEWFLG